MFNFLTPKKDEPPKQRKGNVDVGRKYLAVLEVANIVSMSLSIEEILQQSVDVIVTKLGFESSVIFLNQPQQKRIVSKTFTNKAINLITTGLIRKSFNSLFVQYKETDNYIVRTVLEKKMQQSTQLSDFIVPVVSKRLSATLQRISRTGYIISLPILYHNKPLGAILFTKVKHESFDEDIDVLKLYSNQIAVAIYNSQQYESIAQKNSNLESLYNLTSSISQSLDPAKVIQTAVNTIPMNEELIGITVSTFDRKTKKITPQATTQNEMTQRAQEIVGSFKQYQLDLTNPEHRKNMVVQTIKQGTPQTTKRLSDAVSPVMPAQIVDGLNRLLKINRVVSYPLQSRGEPIGVIVYYLRIPSEDELSPDKQQLFETYSSQISIALENALLYTRSEEISQNLREARRRERDMVDVMGHELRTPISIVRNALLTLEKDFKEDNQVEDQEKLGKYLAMAVESTKREIRLIETMLSATKVEGNKIQLDFTEIDMIDVIEDSIEALKPLADDKQLTITFDKPEQPFSAYADRTRTQEIMDNLLSNAVKYTAAGEVKLAIEQKDDYVWIHVTDTGIGLKDEDIKQLGKKFFRVKAMFSDKPGVVQPSGTGLGLFVTFNLIDLMHGKREIHSEPNNGSTFSFALPLFKGQEEKHLQEAMLG